MHQSSGEYNVPPSAPEFVERVRTHQQKLCSDLKACYDFSYADPVHPDPLSRDVSPKTLVQACYFSRRAVTMICRASKKLPAGLRT
jgi:hypothetical protein